ncbi:MAG: hypothetical protein PHH22_01495 [Clostridia bacterium]|nr:hypothetical protein [Clostridia bacterium]
MIQEIEDQKALLSYGHFDYDNMKYTGTVYNIFSNKSVSLKKADVLEVTEHNEYTELLMKNYDYVILCSYVEIGFCTNVPQKNEYVYWLVPDKKEIGSLNISKTLKVKTMFELPYKMQNTIYIVENEKDESFAMQLYKQN